MSIIRIGLGETEGFADGYEAIFCKKKVPAKPEAEAAPAKVEPEVRKPTELPKTSNSGAAEK